MLDYKSLNKAQYEAVMHDKGPALLLAGAGTGKTRTLIYRVAHLIESGVSPESILLLTFTNKAAEMGFINNLLNLSGDEIYQKYGYKRDETIIHTAKFSNGIEADIKLVISEEESPYTEGVLFHDGYELTRTDPDDVYDGEWDFEFNGLKYIVFVETEK